MLSYLSVKTCIFCVYRSVNVCQRKLLFYTTKFKYGGNYKNRKSKREELSILEVQHQACVDGTLVCGDLSQELRLLQPKQRQMQ
jgi:hypothetical protein